MKPITPVLSPAFKYGDDNNAASHSTPDKFRERMEQRRADAQCKPAPDMVRNVAQIRKAKT